MKIDIKILPTDMAFMPSMAFEPIICSRCQNEINLNELHQFIFDEEKITGCYNYEYRFCESCIKKTEH